MNPQDMIMQQMAMMQAQGRGAPAPGPVPGTPGMALPPPDMRPAMAPQDDEAMLEDVSNQMGGEAPPPTGGMKWQNLQEDQAALMADPSEENVTAFTDYWGEDKLPEELQDPSRDESPEAGE